MKKKINKNMLYTFQANIFYTKVSFKFGITANIAVVANNEKDALNEAKKSFDKYINRLKINHNNDFAYDNLKMI